MLHPRRRRPLLLVVLIAVLLGVAACVGSKARPAPPSFTQSEPLLAVVEEHGSRADLILKAATRPSLQWKFASIPHRTNWGLRASVSPDGQTIAYTVLPPSEPDPDTSAELWTIAPFTGRSKRLAAGVDLRSDLVWSPDSAWVSYVRVTGLALEDRRVSTGGKDELLQSGTTADRWYLMGYEPDGGALAFAHLSGSGTQVVVRRSDGGELRRSTVGPLSSRGFVVLSDGRPALMQLQDEGGRRVYRAVTVEPDGSVRRLTNGGSEDTGIAVGPRGTVYVGSVPGNAGTAQPAQADVAVVTPDSGFDVPLATSPDETFVSLKHFTGSSADSPGAASITILRAGARMTATGDGPLDVAGWMVQRTPGK